MTRISSNHIWWKSQATWEYDPTRTLYDQIDEIVDTKLKWYSELLSNNEYYRYEDWCDLSLNIRYAKITTIVNPKIEEDIKTSTDDEAVFKRITWHIPYFIWRDKDFDLVEVIDEDEDVEIINNCICRRIIPCHKRVWPEDGQFIYSGIYTDNDNFNISIDNETINVSFTGCNFKYVKDTKTLNISKFHYNDNNLYKATIECVPDTLSDMSYAFAKDKMLNFVDLSSCNMNWTTSLEGLFYGDVKLRRVDLSNLDLNVNDPTTTDMFTQCRSLRKIIVKNCNQSTIDQLKCIVVNSGLELSQIEFITK